MVPTKLLDIPKGHLTVVIGVSGSGKASLILEILIPSQTTAVNGHPEHILRMEATDIRQ